MKIIILLISPRKKSEGLPVLKSEMSNFKIERKFNSEKLKNCLKFAGVNPNDSILIINSIKSYFHDCKEDTMLFKEIIDNTMRVYIHKTFFNSLLKEEFIKLALKKKDMFKRDFKLACDVIDQKINVIILLGGASGTGKSSIASHLAYSLSVPTVLSSDSIRHIMRNFMTKEDCPLLFSSTYETHKLMTGEENKEDSESKKCLKGYKIQCGLVQERLERIIENYNDKNESIIIEGVHLTPDFMMKMVKKYKNCLPFEIYIANESKHMERFSVRSKYMTLDKKTNKYVENFKYIRVIQKYCLMKSEELLIPKIDNSNIDKSMGLAHRTILAYLKKVYVKKNLIIQQEKIQNAGHILEQFNRIAKNIWSSDYVKKYIIEKKDGKLDPMENDYDLDKIKMSNQKIKTNYAEDEKQKEFDKEDLKINLLGSQFEIGNSANEMTPKEFDSKEEELKSDEEKKIFAAASIDLSQFIDLIKKKDCLSISNKIRPTTLKLIKGYVTEYNGNVENLMKLRIVKTNRRFMIVQETSEEDWSKKKAKILKNKEFQLKNFSIATSSEEEPITYKKQRHQAYIESKENGSDKDSIKNFNSIEEETVEEEIEFFLEDGFNSIEMSEGHLQTEEQTSGISSKEEQDSDNSEIKV